MDAIRRRRVLRLGGAAILSGLAGCGMFRGNDDDPVRTENDIQDTDGDGVIDSEDYAPRDPDIQREEQIEGNASTATPTETATPSVLSGGRDGSAWSWSNMGSFTSDRITLDGGKTAISGRSLYDGRFVVSLTQPQDDSVSSFINVDNKFDGATITRRPAGEHIVNVQGEGDWIVGIKQPRFTPDERLPLPVERSGEDYAWFGPIRFPGNTKLTFESSTAQSSTVSLFTHEMDYLGNIIDKQGPFSGERTTAYDGMAIVIVRTLGPWDLSITQI